MDLPWQRREIIEASVLFVLCVICGVVFAVVDAHEGNLADFLGLSLLLGAVLSIFWLMTVKLRRPYYGSSAAVPKLASFLRRIRVLMILVAASYVLAFAIPAVAVPEVQEQTLLIGVGALLFSEATLTMLWLVMREKLGRLGFVW